MKTVILAAGIGSRLLPYTKVLPKCLLRVGTKSILEYQIEALEKTGIKDVVIVIGHQGNKIKEVIGNKVKYIENPEYRSTGPSYSLWLAKEELKEGFIYLNSDLLLTADMIKKLLESEYENAIMINKKIEQASTFHKIKMDGHKILYVAKEIDEKADGEAIGPAKFSAEGAKNIFNLIEEEILRGNKGLWCYDIFGRAAKLHDFYGIEIKDLPYIEIDEPFDLEKARNEILPLILKNVYLKKN